MIGPFILLSGTSLTPQVVRVSPSGSTATAEYHCSGTDDDQTIQTAIDAIPAGGIVILLPGDYHLSGTVTITKEMTLAGVGSVLRWHVTVDGGTGSQGVRLIYSGSGDAIHITGDFSRKMVTSVTLVNFALIPSVDGGGTNGIFLDGGNGDTELVESIRLRELFIARFGTCGIYAKGTVFDTRMDAVSLVGNGSYGLQIDPTGALAGGPSQWSVVNCWFITEVSTAWGAYINSESVYIAGCTFSTITAGNGLRVIPGAAVVGCSFEGINETGSIGLWLEEGGAGLFVTGSNLFWWDVGVRIGTAGSANAAVGWMISSRINYNTVDLQITNGGNRFGSILTNPAHGIAVISDLRASVDNVKNSWSVIASQSQYILELPNGEYLKSTDSGGWVLSGDLGFNGSSPVAKGTITGSRGGNAALASLLTYLASRGDITDSSS